MTDYTTQWDALPESVRDKLGTDESFTREELLALVSAGTMVHTQWEGQPPGSWSLLATFEKFAAARLEADAEKIDHGAKRTRTAKVPLDDPLRKPDTTLSMSSLNAGAALRQRAERLRTAEPHRFPQT